MPLLSLDLLAGIVTIRIDAGPPCILPLPAERKPERLSVDGSPQPSRVSEPEKKHGAPSTGSSRNPNSRLGRKPSPHSQGRVMEQPATSPSFVGIDVSKDRLDVHVRPSAQTSTVARDGKGLEQLTSELRDLAPALIVLEATGGLKSPWRRLWPAPACHSPWSIRARSGISPAPPGGPRNRRARCSDHRLVR